MKKFLLASYRNLSIAMIFTVFFAIIWYIVGFALMFGSLSNWVAPMKLSPTQERVLAFQPQVVSMNASRYRLEVELRTAKDVLLSTEEQIGGIDALVQGIKHAQAQESGAMVTAGLRLQALSDQKAADIVRTERSLTDARGLLLDVDREEGAGLITRDQAAVRRISVQASMNQLTDARIQLSAVAEELRQLRTSAALRGRAGSSLYAMQFAQTLQQLAASRAQLRIQHDTAANSVAGLELSLADVRRTLDLVTESPQYRALREEVTVLFVPYTSDATAGDGVYDCLFTYVVCRKVGKIVKVFDAEQLMRHPLYSVDVKGHLAEVRFIDPRFGSSLISFVRRPPFLF